MPPGKHIFLPYQWFHVAFRGGGAPGSDSLLHSSAFATHLNFKYFHIFTGRKDKKRTRYLSRGEKVGGLVVTRVCTRVCVRREVVTMVTRISALSSLYTTKPSPGRHPASPHTEDVWPAPTCRAGVSAGLRTGEVFGDFLFIFQRFPNWGSDSLRRQRGEVWSVKLFEV
jgi:hypothetical protein